jgi:soluble lytic murein transglycosylase
MKDTSRARLVSLSVVAGAALLAFAAPAALAIPSEFSAQKAAGGKAKASPKATGQKAKRNAKQAKRPASKAKAAGRPTAAGKAAKVPPKRAPRAAPASSPVPVPPKCPAAAGQVTAAASGAAAVPMPPLALPPPAEASASAPGRLLAGAVPMLVTPSLAATSEFAAPPPRPPSSALAYAPAAPPSGRDVDAVKEAINLAQRGRTDAATARRDDIRDSAGRKLVEWMILRSNDTNASFGRYAAFLHANPSWPSAGMLRRRAEARLWQEKRDAATVRRFFASQPPLGVLGKLALARALIESGDRAGGQAHLRDAWRQESLSAAMEAQVLEDYGSLLTRADHKVRFDARLYSDDLEAAMRAARRLGAAEVALVEARRAVNRKAGNAGRLLDAVPASLHNDPAFMFTRIQWLRRADRTDEAVRLTLAAPHDPRVIHDPDEWWLERRILVRRLLDEGKFREAYRISRDAAPPTGREHLRVDQPFTAGWVALRFLNDPRAAAPHFAQIAKVTDHPTSLARMDYWLGRTAEASGRNGDARRHYEAAARHTAAYYGQLARARLGHREIPVRTPPALSASERAAYRNAEVVRAVELLYATGNRDLVTTFVADLDRVGDIGALKMIGETAAQNSDPRAMMYLGRDAIGRGLTFDKYAFPTAGLPKYASIGPEARRHLVYSIARQESAFSPRAVSSARAMGYMQVTPAAGRTIARKYGVKFDARRLLNDPVYNMQMGAAEIGSLVQEYDGNHVLAFVAYNAGRGRARDWIARFGDPRDPKVDVVDWVERIPFFETRNYVQRVMENMQVYRAQFEQRGTLTIEADMRGRRP